VAVSCVHSGEPCDYVKGGELLDGVSSSEGLCPVELV
jgi:hypothetical protein